MAPIPIPRTASLVGLYAALATCLLTVATFVVAVLTPPLSGPFCVAADCFAYPYADVASRYPRDYYWMYLALAQLVAFLAMMAAVYESAQPERRIFGLLGLSAAMIASATLLVDYFVQLSVIQPSLLAGEHESMAVLTQFNPHGVFIALEELGYIAMSAALSCVGAVFPGTSRVERSLRWVGVAGFVAMVAAWLGITAMYGLQREYRFEVAVISIDWLVLIPASALLAVVFRRQLR